MSVAVHLHAPARVALNRARTGSSCPELWAALDAVKDPEIPVLSIWDLGILQDVQRTEGGARVVITPTYSGCPAIDTIRQDIIECLTRHGVAQVDIHVRLSPAWSTDWMDRDAKNALREYGIAPPGSHDCPQCGSDDTQLVSEFGSTSCKSMHRCHACLEPFDHFKTLT